jgi:hypothetical protein
MDRLERELAAEVRIPDADDNALAAGAIGSMSRYRPATILGNDGERSPPGRAGSPPRSAGANASANASSSRVSVSVNTVPSAGPWPEGTSPSAVWNIAHPNRDGIPDVRIHMPRLRIDFRKGTRTRIVA